MGPYALLIGAVFLLEIVMNLPLGAAPLELLKDGASPSAAASAVGCGAFSMLVFSLPMGALVDRLGRLFAMRLSAVLMLPVLIGLTVAHGAIFTALLFGLRSLALALWLTAKFAYASNLFSEDRSISTIVTLGMLGNIAFALGPALGVALEQGGVGRGQYAYATIAVLLGIVCVLLLPARHDVRSAPTARAVMVRASWLPAMAFLAGAKMEMGVDFSLAVLTFHHRGVANGALLFTAAAFTSFFLRWPAGTLVERFGSRRIAVPVAMLQALGCCLAACAYSTANVLIAGIVLGASAAAVLPVGLGLLFEQSEQQSRGAATGAYNFACGVGSTSGALLAVFAVSIGFGYPLAIIGCAVVPLVVLPFVSGCDLKNFAGFGMRTIMVARGRAGS